MKITIAVGVIVAIALGVGAALRWRDADASPPPVLLALGDSVTAGVGDDPAIGGYAARVDGALQPGASEEAESVTPRFVNMAEGGATTTSIIEGGQLQRAIDEIRARRATPNPSDDVDVIVMSAGGNDVYGPLFRACATATLPIDPASPCAAAIDELPTVFQMVGNNLGTIVATLRAEAGEESSIVMLTYYNSLQACVLSNLVPLGNVVLEGPDGEIPTPGGFNDVIRAAASSVPGTLIAESYGQLSPGDLVGGQDCLHPDESGHARISELVIGVLGDAVP